ncbi:hypothetical protein [Sphaerisporangium sp. NPDC051011]|uniref:golvesin C-terminal-like domain-containing protein n=1 Tax=Sphaerisporangium sp. NPDC051011 TaxID=3155792 RepID=UPI0033EB7E6D
MRRVRITRRPPDAEAAVPRRLRTTITPRERPRFRALAVGVVTLAVTAGLGLTGVADAAPREDPTTPAAAPPKAAEAVTTVAEARRDELLRPGWRASGDTAWTTSGDQDGLHVLTATARSGYTWRTIATLSEPGFDADQWIGNACLTESGRRLVVTYGPRTFTNKTELFGKGGFVAVVELDTGAVRKVDAQSSLAYFSPGCGSGESAVLSQFTESDEGKQGKTRLTRIDAASGRLGTAAVIDGQLTSALPVGKEIVAADNGRVVRVDGQGRRRALAPARGVPFELAYNGDGVVYMDRNGGDARLWRSDLTGKTAKLAEGELTALGVGRGAGGRVAVFGKPARVEALPDRVTRVDAPVTAALSSDAEVTLTRVGYTTDPRLSAPTGARAVEISATVAATGKRLDFHFTPATGGDGAGRATHPKLRAPGPGPQATPDVKPDAKAGADAQAKPDAQSGARTLVATPSPTSPSDEEGSCAVPRNDPRIQVYQPKPRQVEWAVDQAVMGVLNVTREANWKQSGLPSYTPQGMFPPAALNGYPGTHVPPQVMLGILAQESNLWQATGKVLPGETGNPLIGNYYGRVAGTASEWTINWAKADCGYGVGQVTDGMRKPEFPRFAGEQQLPANQQKAVAVDFAANIARSLRILQDKWNEVTSAGIALNNGHPSRLENWYFAIWAYNSGFHAKGGPGEPWGVGWGNNPINPLFKANRLPFLDATYDDARNPQRWPYQEKVLGWAGHPITSLEAPDTFVVGYRAAWWVSDDARFHVSPLQRDMFCNASNDCDPAVKLPPQDPDVISDPAGPCMHVGPRGRDLKCWYHLSASWKQPDCLDCGNEVLRFDPGYAYQADGNSYPPVCANTLGVPAYIVDDVADSVPSVQPAQPGGGQCHPSNNNGTFSLRFAGETQNGVLRYPGKIDFHQSSGGYGSHFWFAHARQDPGGMWVSGTWTMDRSYTGWMRVMVHMPDHGAHTQQANYKIYTANGVKTRVIPQRTLQNRWVSLGVFPFNGVPKIELTNQTYVESYTGEHDPLDTTEDVAFDAAAFVPLPGKPRNVVVALGDSFSSGEGSGSLGSLVDPGDPYLAGVNFYPESDNNGSNGYRNACHRSKQAWSRAGVMGDSSERIGVREDRLDANMDYHLLACSGAESEQLLPYLTAPWDHPYPTNGDGERGAPRFREPSQLDRGFLDENTTLVTLSIGGNDARFADVVEQCLYKSTPVSCEQSTLDKDTEPLDTATRRRIDVNVPLSIKSVLTEVHKQAPNAKILVMGYPKLLPIDNLWPLTCTIPTLGIQLSERRWLSDMAELMRTRQLEALSDFNNSVHGNWAYFSDPIDEFTGKDICGLPPGINWLVPVKDPGDSPSRPVSSESFHPSIIGQGLYADSMNETLRRMGL